MHLFPLVRGHECCAWMDCAAKGGDFAYIGMLIKIRDTLGERRPCFRRH